MKTVDKNSVRMKTFLTWSGSENSIPEISKLNEKEIFFENELQLNEASSLKGLTISFNTGVKWHEHEIYNWDWIEAESGNIKGLAPIFNDSEKFKFEKDLSIAQC